MACHRVAFFILVLTTSLTYGLDLTPYLQPDVIDDDLYLSTSSGNLCARKCDGTPKTCYYKFKVEHYSSMGPSCGDCAKNNLTDCYNRYCVSADGINRNIITVNRQLPGTQIQVCKGDTVIVDVTNILEGKTTSIHWHGLLQQGTPHMDGVYMVTQCPIVPAQTFRYKFTANDPGTHYWHDHSGFTKQDGVQGPLIVREPEKEDVNSNLYDYDLPSHNVFITDWKQYISDNEFPELNKAYGENKVSSLLINGKGAFPGENPAQSIMDRKGPISTFVMEPGKRYRLRLIGAMCMDCPIEFSIEDHKLLLIATDGNPVEPILLDSVVLHTGERYDVVVTANQRLASYWMKTRGMKPCHSLSQLAVVAYEGAYPVPMTQPKDHPNGPQWTINLPNYDDKGQGDGNVWISNLKGKNKISQLMAVPRSEHFVEIIKLGSYTYKKTDFKTGRVQAYYQPTKGWNTRTVINNITSLVPPSPMLTQMTDIPREDFCSPDCYKGLTPDKCTCIQKYKYPLNSTVDFIVIDTSLPDGTTHPFHMHGYRFYVLEQGVLGKDKDTCIQKVYDRALNGGVSHPSPPGKDTIMVPSGGYAVIRFLADNPGVWVFHCHYIYHNALGMSAYIQTGEVEEFPAPPHGFPKCGNFLPSV